MTENKFIDAFKRMLTMTLALIMVLGSVIPVATQEASAFDGKKGSKYTVTDGGRITYGSGEGGYSNSRKCDLGDDLGSRYSYCVQPAKLSPGTGTVTVDKVVTDDNDTGKWNALRNIVYYSPSYPGYDNNVTNNSLYLLNKLSEWSSASSSTGVTHPLGTLPSYDEMLTTLDANNSSHSKTTKYSHDATTIYTISSYNDSVSNSFSIRLATPMQRERMDYQRGMQVDTLMSRNTAFINPSIYFSHDLYKRNRGFSVNYDMTTTAPAMTSLINMRDDSNPLFITLGNPHLKNTRTHSFGAGYRDKWHKMFFNSAINASITENAVASGFIYNKETGVRTVTPENVNGNWNLGMNVNANLALDKDDKWRIMEGLSYNHNNSVDLSGTNASLSAMKSVVKNDYINENLSLTWRPTSKYEFGANGRINYQHSTSDREGFTTMNVYTFNYGARAQLELPWNFQVSTDITMYSRRGYSEESMNTNELVWNARVAKRLLKGKLTIMFDGFDLLGNLSNVQRYVNAQGRTETFNNVIPSYGILHAIYRINVPKKP